jgi:maleylacetoacetate isomerase
LEQSKVIRFYQIPAFVTEDGDTISQSLAIIEFLEEKYPTKFRLMPDDPLLKAKVSIGQAEVVTLDLAAWVG